MNENTALLNSAKAGCDDARQRLLMLHRIRLKAMVRMRLHPRVRSRVDDSDVVQEALLDASQRIQDYFDKSSMPFFAWLRFITNQKILQCHRHHFDVQKRSLKNQGRLPTLDDSVSINMAHQLVSRERSPSSVMMLDEATVNVRRVLDSLKEADREILCMRHFEQLSNAEVAQLLDITPSNASTSYLRALAKLQSGLRQFSDQ